MDLVSQGRCVEETRHLQGEWSRAVRRRGLLLLLQSSTFSLFGSVHLIVMTCLASSMPMNGPVPCVMVTVYLPVFGSRHENPQEPPQPYSRSWETTSFCLSSTIRIRPLMSSDRMCPCSSLTRLVKPL